MARPQEMRDRLSRPHLQMVLKRDYLRSVLGSGVGRPPMGLPHWV